MRTGWTGSRPRRWRSPRGGCTPTRSPLSSPHLPGSPPTPRPWRQLSRGAPAGASPLIWRAAGRLGLTARAAGAAAERGIVTREPRPAFRHPLIRSAVYADADPGQRRQVHSALAAACDSVGDAERSAWHRAEAATGTDAQVAAQLDAPADLAPAPAGHSEQALFLSRAAELTTAPERRAERLLAAAGAHLISGDPAAAETLLDIAAAPLNPTLPRPPAPRPPALAQPF